MADFEIWNLSKSYLQYFGYIGYIGRTKLYEYEQRIYNSVLLDLCG